MLNNKDYVAFNISMFLSKESLHFPIKLNKSCFPF